MPFDDLNKSAIAEFTEESRDDEDVDDGAYFTNAPEDLGADDENENGNILCG